MEADQESTIVYRNPIFTYNAQHGSALRISYPWLPRWWDTRWTLMFPPPGVGGHAPFGTVLPAQIHHYTTTGLGNRQKHHPYVGFIHETTGTHTQLEPCSTSVVCSDWCICQITRCELSWTCHLVFSICTTHYRFSFRSS